MKVGAYLTYHLELSPDQVWQALTSVFVARTIFLHENMPDISSKLFVWEKYELKERKSGRKK